jgi:hypothetical protein
MSVKISRREEKRNTSLRDFILAAVFPLLLTGLIGFLIGKAGGVDGEINSSELVVLSKQAKKANLEATEMRGLIFSIDSLRDELQDTAEDFDESFYKAIEAGSNEFDIANSPLQRWAERLTAAERNLADALADDIFGPSLGRKILSEDLLDATTDPLRDLIQEKFKALRKRKSDYIGKNINTQDVSALISQQEEEAKTELDDTKDDLKLANKRMQFLQADYDNCQKNLTRAQVNEPPLPPSFELEKKSIQDAIQDIRSAVPELAKGFLGKKKDIHLRIISAVEEIEEATGRIK